MYTHPNVLKNSGVSERFKNAWLCWMQAPSITPGSFGEGDPRFNGWGLGTLTYGR